MKSCCVPLCENDTFNRPDLKYFPLPKKVNVRNEWLEVLGIKGEYRSQQISICEIHFRVEDFRAGRKDLKVHAVPVLCLQPGIIDHIGGEDEFIPDESDCRPDLLNGMIKDVEPKKATPSSAKKRRLADEIIIKQEPEPEPEPETGRRPSRRAALVAAKKISSTVRQCGVKDNDPGDPTINPITPKTPASSRKNKVDHAKQNKVDLDLEMVCEDEELSSVQCTFLKLAQDEYNLALKNLRELAACNVRIIQQGDMARHINLNAPVNLFAPNGSVLKVHNKVKSSPKSSNTHMVSILAKNSTQSKVPIIYL